MNNKGFFFLWWGGDKVIEENYVYENKCPYCKKKGKKYLTFLSTRYTIYSIIPFGRKKLVEVWYSCSDCGYQGKLLDEQFENAKKLYESIKENEKQEQN